MKTHHVCFELHEKLLWNTAILSASLFVLATTGFSPTATASETNVFRDTLTNGLRVIVVRNPLSPVVTTVMNYRAGSDESPPGFPGTAHAEEHMMFRGSPGLSAGQLANVAAALGGNFNADTQPMVTQYYFTAPADDLNVLLQIEAIRMRESLDTETLWALERGAIEQEVAQDLSNPKYLLYTNLLASLFAGTPYAVDALGTRPSFDKTTGVMLKKFHDTWYVPNNAILVIAGDVEPKNAFEQTKKHFGGIPSKALPKRLEFNFRPAKPGTFEMQSDLPYGIAVIAFRLPGTDDPDWAAAQVLSDVLSSQRGALYDLVPQGKALSASFSYDTMPRASLGYATAEFPAGGNASALLDQMRTILAAQATNGVMADLVEAAKRREVASAEFQKNSIIGLAMVWSQAVAVEGRQSPDDDIKAIQQVTVADVNRVAKKYLDLGQAVTAVLMPQPSGKPVSAKSFRRQETFTRPQSEAVKLPNWASNAVTAINMPVSSLNPISNTLPNGLKLIIQPESTSRAVNVFGRIKSNADMQTPAGQEGVDQVLDELLSYGTKSLDRLAFQKALDEIGAIASAGTDFSLQVLAEHFERGVQLLAANELAPALPESAFIVIQPQLAAAVAGELESPKYLADRALKLALFPTNDPTHRQATPQSIKSLSLEDVRNYHHRVFRPDLTTIVVIGNVKTEKAQAVISKYFGGWKAVGPKPEVLLPGVPSNRPSVTHVPDASRVQDRVVLAQTLGLMRTNADYYPLELGNHVLGGAFYATRFFHDLRETSGLVYSVKSSFDVGETRSVYTLTYACDPGNVAKARTIAETDLKQMRDLDVTAEELRQARALLLREIPLSESSVEKIAEGWLYRSLHGLPLDEPMRAARRYLELSADEVKAAYARWVRPGDLVQVVQGPNPE